jgi:hypothetical protein
VCLPKNQPTEYILPNVTEMKLNLEASTAGIPVALSDEKPGVRLVFAAFFRYTSSAFSIVILVISNPRLDSHRYSITGRFARARTVDLKVSCLQLADSQALLLVDCFWTRASTQAYPQGI